MLPALILRRGERPSHDSKAAEDHPVDKIDVLNRAITPTSHQRMLLYPSSAVVTTHHIHVSLPTHTCGRHPSKVLPANSQ